MHAHCTHPLLALVPLRQIGACVAPQTLAHGRIGSFFKPVVRSGGEGRIAVAAVPFLNGQTR